MECLGGNRAQLLAVFEKIIDGVHDDKKRNIDGQCSLFEAIDSKVDDDNLPDLKEFSQKTLLTMEKEMLGIYISGHPLAPYEEEIKKASTITTTELLELSGEIGEEVAATNIEDGKAVSIAGIIISKKNKITKNNNMMAFVTLEDLYGSVEVIVFPATYDRYSKYLEEDSIVVVEGRISLSEEDEPKIICRSVSPLTKCSNEKLYVKISAEKSFDTFNVLKKVLIKYAGDTPVVVYLEKDKMKVIAERSLWVDSENEKLIQELKEMLGENCVKVC